MAEEFEVYLGTQAFDFLNTKPFSDWQFEKSIEEDLEKPIFHYVFEGNGLELRSDAEDKISVVFLYADEFGGFDDSLMELKFGWSREGVLQRFGEPSKMGKASSHPILGDFGAWDRFSMGKYSIRFEYKKDATSISKITYIREDVVP